jgi:copper chaperone CopZ
MKMKMKFLSLLAVVAFAGAVTGCVETVDGHSEAGVPFVKDSVEGRYEVSPQRVFDAAKAVLKFNGALVSENLINNSLEGKVNQETVWVQVEQIDNVKPVTRVVVQVRTRARGTDIDLAHDIEKQIAIKLVEQH